MNALRFATQGLVLAVALPGLASCASNVGDGAGVSEESATAVTAPGQPFSNWLQTNDPKFRGFAATHMERQLDPLLKSNQASDSALREMALITIRALREGGDKVCDDSAKIRVFRGHGFGLLPPVPDMAKTGKPLVLANYLTSDLGRFKGTDWEAQALKLFPAQKTSFDAGLAAFAVGGLQCGNGNPDDGQVNKYDYAKLAKRHSLFCTNSLFISTSIDPEVARGFKAPIIEARVCPGRVFPTSFQPFGNELEYLAFGFLLPEEIVKIHGPEVTNLYRLGLTDPRSRDKADDKGQSLPLPPLSETELNRCSGNTIGFQSEAAIGLYVEKKLNVLTSQLASNLEKERTGTKIGGATWKADFAKTCNCDTFVKDNAKNRADYCE